MRGGSSMNTQSIDFCEHNVTENTSNIQKLTYTIPEVARILNISVAQTYSLVNRNIIPNIRLGKRILVSIKKLEEFVNK